MGLFSDLLSKAGDVKLNDLAKDLNKAVKDLGKAVNEAAEKAGIDLKEVTEKAKAAEAERASQESTFDASPAAEEDGPSGFSWGPVMPAEENQYNYGGTYLQYFDHIFADDFPGYEVKREPGYGGKSTVYTLADGGRTALIVELLPSSSESVKLRQSCRQQGIPYLRFYFDHDGWWNTRAYVNDRVRKALGI
jgi:hypothetical protein